MFMLNCSPKEEQYGPLVLKEAGNDTERDDPWENGEEQEGKRDHDEEQRVRSALVVECGSSQDVDEWNHRRNSVYTHCKIKIVVNCLTRLFD